MYLKRGVLYWTKKQRHSGSESQMLWFDHLPSKYYHPDVRAYKNKTPLEHNCILSSNYINLHGRKGFFTYNIHVEVQIHFHCSSHNPKIIHGRVQLTQNFPKQTDAWSASNSVNMHYYLNKHLKPCGYTPSQITSGPKSHKIRYITFTLVVYSWIINYIGKYIFLHNDHVNKYHRVNTKNSTEGKESKSTHLHISPHLNGAERMTHHKSKHLLQY